MTTEISGPQFLEQVKSELEHDEDVTRSVREFISYWNNASRRGPRIVRWINRDLRNAGLLTVPDFNETALDSTIHFEIVKEAPPEPPKEYGLLIGKMPSARGGVTTVDPGDSLLTAYTKMQLFDYSQLVVANDGAPTKKTVTWRSIVMAQLRGKHQVRDAVTDAEVARVDQDLLREAKRIAANDYVLVEDEHGAIAGIVTTSDISMLLAGQSETFLHIGEIDQRLRDAILEKIAIAEIISITGDKRIEDADDLTMFHYQRIVATDDAWKKLKWPLDQQILLQVLDTVRQVRNDVMHFNPDPIEPERLATVGALVRLLRDHL